tara:strand:+ start:1708 stop:1881 length:174 start_codon:yes stop_codon:yes gene_type:complete
VIEAVADDTELTRRLGPVIQHGTAVDLAGSAQPIPRVLLSVSAVWYIGTEPSPGAAI